MGQALLIVLLIALTYFALRVERRIEPKEKSNLKNNFPPLWLELLEEYIPYYQKLSNEDKFKFENRIVDFLYDVNINGANTEVDDLDKILVASSAIIPVFNFENWKYPNLREVTLYPNRFDEHFNIGGDKNISGMVGTGSMDGRMILSKPALHLGFKNETDKKNVGIHEFVHLIDKADGEIDGIPKVLIEKQYVIPWIDLVEKNIEEQLKRKKQKVDFNPYGLSSKIEFFAVLSEYFFERPELLEKKHPDLFKMLNDFYK